MCDYPIQKITYGKLTNIHAVIGNRTFQEKVLCFWIFYLKDIEQYTAVSNYKILR